MSLRLSTLTGVSDDGEVISFEIVRTASKSFSGRQGASFSAWRLHWGVTNEERDRWATRALVLGGLVASGVVAVWEWPAEHGLPAMALGSPTVLVVERAALLFAAWLSLAVVAAEAWRGRLPIEISGRGVKYAEATAGQAVLNQTAAALRRHGTDIEALRREVADLARRPEGNYDGPNGTSNES